MLKQPLLPVGNFGEPHIPLTKALALVGLNTKGTYFLFGVEVILKEGKEPTVSLDLKEGSTVGTALDSIISQLPDYEYEVVDSHLINVFPQAAKRDLKDLLNIQVPRFDVVDQPVAHRSHCRICSFRS